MTQERKNCGALRLVSFFFYTGEPEVAKWLEQQLPLRLPGFRTQLSVHEDVARSPASLRGLKNLALLQPSVWVRDAARIWPCCGCGVGLNCNSDWTPSLGPSS